MWIIKVPPVRLEGTLPLHVPFRNITHYGMMSKAKASSKGSTTTCKKRARGIQGYFSPSATRIKHPHVAAVEATNGDETFKKRVVTATRPESSNQAEMAPVNRTPSVEFPQCGQRGERTDERMVLNPAYRSFGALFNSILEHPRAPGVGYFGFRRKVYGPTLLFGGGKPPANAKNNDERMYLENFHIMLDALDREVFSE